MIKAVLFDFDGTLINTNDLIFQSYNHAFQKVFHRDIKLEEFLKFYGRPLRKSIIEEYGDDGYNLVEKYRVFNAENHDRLIKKFPGTTEGLILLKENNIKLGVVTSKRKEMVLKGIDFLEYGNMFDALVTLDDTTKHKPDPEPILRGCEILGTDPKNTIYVGDSIFDIIAGHAAGTKTCAVKYSLTSKEELLSHNPDYYCDTIFDFAKKIIQENKYE